jgi:hypothetical protein
MSRVRLDREWTDAEGVTHAAGETVEVDDDTLTELLEAGIVEAEPPAPPAPPQAWAGPTARPEGGDEIDIDDTDLGR